MTQDASSGGPAQEGGREPRTVLLGGLLAATVLGAGAFFLLGGSDDTDATDVGADVTDVTGATAPTVTGSATDAVTAPVEAGPASTPVAMPAAVGAGGKNPFAVLYTAPVAGSGSTGSGTDSSGSGAAASGSTGKTVSIGASSTSEGVAVSLAPADVSPDPYVLELASITPADGQQVRTTSWVVDGEAVGPVFSGQRFGTYGELVVLAVGTDEQGETVLLQVGDAAPRLIHVGEKGSVL